MVSSAVIDFPDLVSGEITAVKGVFVVMHPNFENTFINSDLPAKITNIVFVTFLHLPTKSFGEFMHLLFLKLTELCSESFTRSVKSMLVVVVVVSAGEIEIGERS